MPTTSTKSPSGFRRLAARYGPKVAIIATGVLVAIGTLPQTQFLPKPTVTEKPFADVLGAKTAARKAAEAAVKPWSVLDAGVEHNLIAKWMDRLTTSQRRGVEQTLGRKTQYEEMIASKLEERQMPADLIYLAMIESNFNPNATSRVKAKGLWQFMTGTAREVGLTVSGKTDERTNPEKSTDAALTYLQQLYKRFGSWYLAAAAYNSGGGTVSKALRKTTGRTTGTDEDFFLILPRLPKETQDYVPKLIATARVGNDPARYGLKVSESAGDVELSAVSAAPPKAATVDKVRTGTARKITPKRTTVARTSAARASTTKAATTKTATKKPAVKKPAVKSSTVKKPVAKKPVRRPDE
jgi:hypothetical protein